MREALEVTYIAGGKEEVVAYFPDFVKFEERFDKNPIVVTFDAYRVTNQGFLAWAALTREGRTSLPWEEWLNTVENVRVMDEVETDHVPLESDQAIGSLPDSQ